MTKSGKKQRQQARAQPAENPISPSSANKATTTSSSADTTNVNEDNQDSSIFKFSSPSAIDPTLIDAVVKGDAPRDALSFFWKRVHTDDPVSHPYPWRFEQREGRGYVAVANRSYKKGDHICVEEPLIWVRGHPQPRFTLQQIKDMKKKVTALNEEDRAAFFSLHNVYQENEHPKELGIFITCSLDDYEYDDVEGTSQSLIYYAFCSLKHSCIPNVNTIYMSDDQKRLDFYAERDIAEGEEMTASVINLCQIRSVRRKELKDRYRFDCQCSACEYDPSFRYPSWKQGGIPVVVSSKETFEQFVKMTDTCRKQCEDCSSKVSALVDRDQEEQAREHISKLIKVLELPMNQLWCASYISNLYAEYSKLLVMQMTIWGMSYGDYERAAIFQKDAKAMAIKAYETSVIVSGLDSLESKRFEEMAETEFMDFQGMVDHQNQYVRWSESIGRL